MYGWRNGLKTLVILSLSACRADSDQVTGPVAGLDDQNDGAVYCNVPIEELNFIQPPDAIPALTDPSMVGPSAPRAAYLSDRDRVVGLIVNGAAIAIPLNILRYHEIVNLNRDDTQIAVSYCPLTGSALTFDRAVVGGAELGVSGILSRNNLVLFNRGDDPSFFTQMKRSAQCGVLARRGTALPMVASWEIVWGAWKALHPDTEVVSVDTGYNRAYDINPNTEYERLDNKSVLMDVPIDERRPPKERVLGVPAGFDGGWAFPFGELAKRRRVAEHIVHNTKPGVVLWDREAEAATAFFTTVGEEALTFSIDAAGFRDAETGSLWRIDGLGIEGPLAGHRLDPIADAYVAFWFAWVDFHPETVIWQ
jgi:hypothetical protein